MPPRSHNLYPFRTRLYDEYCGLALWSDSYFNIHGANVHYCAAEFLKAIAGRGIPLLGFNLPATRSFDVFAEQGLRPLNSSATVRPSELTGSLVPGALIGTDQWDATDESQPWADGRFPFRVQQRGAYSGNTNTNTTWITFRTDGAVYGDGLVSDVNLNLTVAYWRDASYTGATHAGARVILAYYDDDDPGIDATAVTVDIDQTTGSGSGVEWTTTSYGGSKATVFGAAEDSPAIQIAGTTADETGLIPPHFGEFVWHIDNPQSHRGVLLYNDAQSDFGFAEWSTGSSSPVSGNSIPPRKGFFRDDALAEMFASRPGGVNTVLIMLGENDDRDSGGAVFSGTPGPEDDADYAPHFAVGGGMELAVKATIERAFASGADRVLLMTSPHNTRESGSTGALRYEDTRNAAWRAYQSVGDPRVSWLDLYQIDGGFMDANEATYFQADNVHPTQVGAAYLVGLILDEIESASGAARSRNFRARGWGVR